MVKNRDKASFWDKSASLCTADDPEVQGIRDQYVLAVWLCLATYTLGVALRFLEAPLWLRDPSLRVGEGMLFATHDAYFWLAGAEGMLSTAPDAQRTAIPDLVAFLSTITGLAPSLLGFWLPILMAPLAAIPVCLVVARWRMPEAGLWAGLMAAAAPGYWQRTRLGYLDDDLLLIPVLLFYAGGLVMLLAPIVRKKWPGPVMVKRLGARDTAMLLVGAVLLGWWARLCVWIYPKGFVLILAMACTALFLGVFAARPGTRAATAGVLLMLFASWLCPWWVTLLGVVGIGTVLHGSVSTLGRMAGRFLPGPRIGLPLACWAVVVTVMIGREAWLSQLEYIWGRVIFFYRAVATDDTRGAIFLGNVAEADNLPFWATSYLLCGHWSLLILGLACYMALLWKRPTAAVFLPLAGIAVLAFFLGARFSVYSGTVFGLGLGCGFALILQRFGVAPRRRLLIMVVLLPVVFWPLSHGVRHHKPMPVVSDRLVKAFQATGKMAADDALAWNYWDLGSATFYYSGLQAVEMRLINKSIFAAALSVVSPTRGRERMLEYGTQREHYVIVAWDVLGKLENLLAVGTYDAQAGKSARRGKVIRLTDEVELEMQRGFLRVPWGVVQLHILDAIDPAGPRRHVWPWNGNGHHAVLNLHDRTGYLLEPEVAKTLYVQLLLGPPEAVEQEFDLVVDDYPWVRVFRVNRKEWQ